MIVLGIDPGKTIGLCLYDTVAARVLAAECCAEPGLDDAIHRLLPLADAVSVERPRMYGVGGNDIADACEQAGWIVRRCGGLLPRESLRGGANTFGTVYALERRAVTAALSTATGQQVKGDAGVWAALVALHGGDECKRKGGALHGVASHARQALAVAWSVAAYLPEPESAMILDAGKKITAGQKTS
jgi:hypothetical protein